MIVWLKTHNFFPTNTVASWNTSLPLFLGTYRPLNEVFHSTWKYLKTFRYFAYFYIFDTQQLFLRYVVTGKSFFLEAMNFFSRKMKSFFEFLILTRKLDAIIRGKKLKYFVISLFRLNLIICIGFKRCWLPADNNILLGLKAMKFFFAKNEIVF